MTAPAPTPAARLVTVEDACDQLGIEKTKAYELMNSGELAYVKFPPGTKNSGRRIEQAQIDAFIARNRVQQS